MLSAKMKPAQAFCNLLDRLVRANESGLNASKILGDAIETRKMREDWSRYVNHKTIVAREVPCGGAEAEKILREEVIHMLSIDEFSEEFEIKTEDGKTPKRSVSGDQASSVSTGDSSFSKSEVMLLKWAQYLNSLPPRFPYVSPRLFLLCLSGLLTASLREISMNGGEGFGAWWVVRCWIDEWMGWSAELGGFLKTASSVAEDKERPRELNGENPSSESHREFGTDLVFEGGFDGTNTEGILGGEESTRLAFPGQAQASYLSSKDKKEAERASNEKGDDGYEFITTGDEDRNEGNEKRSENESTAAEEDRPIQLEDEFPLPAATAEGNDSAAPSETANADDAATHTVKDHGSASGGEGGGVEEDEDDQIVDLTSFTPSDLEEAVAGTGQGARQHKAGGEASSTSEVPDGGEKN